MNAFKEQMKEVCKKALEAKGIEWKSFNNDLHWKIGSVNFYPTTGKWRDESTEETGEGYKDLIKYLKPKPLSVKALTPEQMFDIAKKVKPMNLNAVCEALHKAIYKGK